MIVGGFGDLGSERAYLRAETLTCVHTDRGVIEVPLDTYAVGEDGKIGIRGRLVRKQGALLAKALQAGVLTAFSKSMRDGGFAAVRKGSAVEDHGLTLPMLHMPPGRVLGKPADDRDRH